MLLYFLVLNTETFSGLRVCLKEIITFVKKLYCCSACLLCGKLNYKSDYQKIFKSFFPQLNWTIMMWLKYLVWRWLCTFAQFFVDKNGCPPRPQDGVWVPSMVMPVKITGMQADFQLEICGGVNGGVLHSDCMSDSWHSDGSCSPDGTQSAPPHTHTGPQSGQKAAVKHGGKRDFVSSV